MNDQEIINNLDLLLEWEDFSEEEVELIEKLDEVMDLENAEVPNEK